MLTDRQQHCLQGIGIRQWVNRSSMPLRITNQEPVVKIDADIESRSPASVTAPMSAALPVQARSPIATPELVPVAKIIPKIEFNLDSWDNINQSIELCKNCNLASACTQKVPGIGNRQADLMIIGEGPGQDEDIKGEPFVGRPGVLLDKILQSVGIARSQVFITNIVKCRPPNNRDPHKDEVKACDSFLRAQIKQISPKVILLVGRISANSLLNTSEPVAKLIAQNHQLVDSDIPVKVTYHPSYLLRNPAAKAVVWQDMKLLHQMLNP
jgi:uracil-DNA glycosylase family 4